MPQRAEVCYFGAGPAPLPTAVLEAGAQAFVNFEQSGLSLVEISHRSPTATKILKDTKNTLITLLNIPDTHEVLFMHGGGTGEFSAVVLNLVAVWVERRRRRAEKELGDSRDAILERVRKEVRNDLKLDYLVTGSWSLKASQEAANLLEPLGKNFVNIVTDARQSGGNFGSIPPEDTWRLTPTRDCGSALVYYCDNETVDGVEFPGFPASLGRTSEEGDDERIIVADMSSNFLSRKVDVSKYGVSEDLDVFANEFRPSLNAATLYSNSPSTRSLFSTLAYYLGETTNFVAKGNFRRRAKEYRDYRRDFSDCAQRSPKYNTDSILSPCHWRLVVSQLST